MKIKLMMIGKTGEPWLEEGIRVYVKRLVHYADFTMEVIPDIKNGGSFDAEKLKELESVALLKKIDARDVVFLLDEKGKNYSSIALAALFRDYMMSGDKQLIFVIGGAFGFGKKLYDRASALLSLSDMTFSHQMVRLIFVEQIYRAFTIIKGESYHHK